MWDWQAWRCLDEVRETFEERGWEPWNPERLDNEVVPLLAESGEHRIAFYARDPKSGECIFELRDKRRPVAMFIRGTHNIPTPAGASDLLDDRGAAMSRSSSPDDRVLYELPTATVGGSGTATRPARMHNDFTYSDPEGSFTWINPISMQREYLVPPNDHEEAIRLFREHPEFEKLLKAYRGASEPERGTTSVRDAVRSGLKRVEDTAEPSRDREAGGEDNKDRGP